jgi:hypothetical protein
VNLGHSCFVSEQSYHLDYAICDYKEGVTGFSAKLLLSVRSWREKLRARSERGFGCSTSDGKRSASYLSYITADRVSGVGWWVT